MPLPDDRLSAPPCPAVVLLPWPALILSDPPDALSPALKLNVPPAPLSPLPTDTLTAPPLPLVAAPLPTEIDPLLPELDVPELNTNFPLTPLVPAFFVPIVMAPLLVAVPAPLTLVK